MPSSPPRPAGELRRPPSWVLAGSPALRSRLGAARRGVTETAQRADPSRLRLRRLQDGRGTAVVCVYRRRNAEVVAAALSSLPQGTCVRLWALDAVAPALADRTSGTGPGTRFALLNALVRTLPPGVADRALVLLDDDVRFVVGGLDALLGTGLQAGLDLFQPSHTARSIASYGFVRRGWGCVVRRTTFVEQGPVVVLSSAAQRILLPLPEDVGMGWGVEVRWSGLIARHALAMGVVDAVGLRHLSPPGGEYDRAAAERVLAEALSAAGLSSLSELQRDLHRASVGARDLCPSAPQGPRTGG